MKNTKQRFNQRFVKFSTNLEGRLFVHGRFQGRMILEDQVSKEEKVGPGESWSLGRTNDGYWVVFYRNCNYMSAGMISPGRSLKSLDVIIPLPDDLHRQFEKVIKRRSQLVVAIKRNRSISRAVKAAGQCWAQSAVQDYINFVLGLWSPPPVIDGRQRRIYVDTSCMLSAYTLCPRLYYLAR